MAKTIVQEVVFSNTTPETLYNLYMDAGQHSIISGSPVEISETEGSSFSAHNGYITGKNLFLVKNKQIVQTWRGANWSAGDADSTFIINMEQKGNDVVLLATHANLPDEHAGSIETGWHDHYWNPWKQHLAGETITRPQM